MCRLSHSLLQHFKSKVHLLSLSTTAVLLACGALTSVHADSTPTQNVLLILVDDLKPELGCYGSDIIQTPNMDQLAADGLLFEHHYVQQAVCGPSRASMLSGLRPDRTKVWDLAHTAREENPEVFTVQQYFKERGYETAGAGKIMHGFKNHDPLSWSIPYVSNKDLPYFGGKVPALDKYQAPAIHQAVAELDKQKITHWKKRIDFVKSRGFMPATECLDVDDAAYADGALADWGNQMLEQLSQSKKQFFLTLGFNKPHLPFVAPKKYWDLYQRSDINLAAFRDAPKGAPEYARHSWGELRNYTDVARKGDLDDEQQRQLIHGYYASVSYVDAQIGKVLAELKRTGLDENTIVLLWGDHGWHLGDHGLWCKHSNFEQATHSPLIISAPGFEKNQRAGAPVESVDIFPTLCQLAALPIPAQIDGTSLVPMLQDADASIKDFAISQYPRTHKGLMGYALRTERYRMVVWIDDSVAQTGEFHPKQIDAIELYDYETDPDETVSQANNPEYKPVLDRLMEQLEGFFK
ncbi:MULTISPECIES: sulfatase [unclassified Lentimonas]|uniref:sulfatase n=1 Tax=unclassified Lentimonas TaxID=2630993 RepID=UPI00132597DD|nr:MULTISPECIES: sulfatase [unclassified Lentimonas]CAA6678070.1 Choline-sulfatase (EC [Lentimonas sp. CC4]CAA6687471.1 Choline-sulfatase (EC [Lentimonas sp. CC6]CAA7076355.1 Choline-sulfatase (EC [Lentimonas sp. CC4]CAA7172088.1 Choline-sulfatase (EC [Lentimonas sp. CC21]CAA7180671.1 Choline-sulfatase (EC [Lentimonas sp. CC8]